MKLHRPFRPWYVSQKWGVANPFYEQFGFSRHNGLDVVPLKTTPPYINLKTWPIYCPEDGFYVFGVYYSPNGAGHELVLASKKELDLPTGKGHLHISFMHNEKILVPPGYEPKKGELLCIGDNSGASTGPHSHIGGYRKDNKGRKLDENDSNGSFNIEPLFLQTYAADQATLPTLLKSNLRYYSYKAGLL